MWGGGGGGSRWIVKVTSAVKFKKLNTFHKMSGETIPAYLFIFFTNYTNLCLK